MLVKKQSEEAIIPNYNGSEQHHVENRDGEEEEENQSSFNVKNLLWHGGSAWDAWFSCASNQVQPPFSPNLPSPPFLFG